MNGEIQHVAADQQKRDDDNPPLAGLGGRV
jgi:hypothetical protein